MRVVSSVPAPSTTTRAVKSMTSLVSESMTRTPLALLVASSSSTSRTTEYGRSVMLPVSRAGAISAAGEWNDGVEIAAAAAAAAAHAALPVLVVQHARRW